MNYALVAGGSDGIGYAIAKALAKRKYNLILTARHIHELSEVKRKLEKQYQIRVITLKIDLATPTAADEIATFCAEKELPLKMLCNVAGLGGNKDYLKLPLEDLRYMV